MNAAVDFLPASYRARLAVARARRERWWLLLPVLAGLFATDTVLRSRVRIAREMAQQANDRATTGAQHSTQVEQLAGRVDAERAMLAQWIRPLAAPRMTAVFDDLLTSQPPGMAVQTMSCRLDPWAPEPRPSIRVDATCDSVDGFTTYLAALRASATLPAMLCQRTFTSPGAGIGFQLQSSDRPEGPR